MPLHREKSQPVIYNTSKNCHVKKWEQSECSLNHVWLVVHQQLIICGKFIGHCIQISRNDHEEDLHLETGFRSM